MDYYPIITLININYNCHNYCIPYNMYFPTLIIKIKQNNFFHFNICVCIHGDMYTGVRVPSPS